MRSHLLQFFTSIWQVQTNTTEKSSRNYSMTTKMVKELVKHDKSQKEIIEHKLKSAGKILKSQEHKDKEHKDKDY